MALKATRLEIIKEWILFQKRRELIPGHPNILRQGRPGDISKGDWEEMGRIVGGKPVFPSMKNESQGRGKKWWIVSNAADGSIKKRAEYWPLDIVITRPRMTLTRIVSVEWWGGNGKEVKETRISNSLRSFTERGAENGAVSGGRCEIKWRIFFLRWREF